MQDKQDKHHTQVMKSLTGDSVFLVIDGVEYEYSSWMAKELGEALYKTGADQADKAA
jgi:hypothetical protein